MNHSTSARRSNLQFDHPRFSAEPKTLKPEGFQTSKDNELAFYVVSNRNPESNNEAVVANYNLTLPNAITIYNGYTAEQQSVLGVMKNGVETDLVHRLDEENVLVSDYQEMDEWKHDPYVCIAAISLLMANLDIHRQKATLLEAKSVQPSAELPRSNQRFERGTADAHCMTRPFEERLHVMRMKDTEELRPCFLKSRETVERLGVEPTMDKYDLIYSETVQPGEAMVDVCKRYHLDVPTGYQGYAPSVSDVLVYQTRNGCHALYIDSLGFELVQRFVRPPGWHRPEDLIHDPIYALKGEAR